jgi:indolepyruvate decarboxylase
MTTETHERMSVQQEVNMTKTVIQYVLSHLHDIGEKDIFGVAGDFAFPIHDAICSDRSFRYVGSYNELDTTHATDSYARVHGISAVSTTYGVGELSAINGIAGFYAGHLRVFHLVGMLASGVQATHRLVHHTFGNGEFDLFHKWQNQWSARVPSWNAISPAMLDSGESNADRR